MNQVQTTARKFSVQIQTDGYQKLINNTLGDKLVAQRFIAAISSAVAVNPNLQECDAGTILSGALLGESLKLAHSPQLGHYYLVPYNTQNGKKAQFQLGYKGYIQLAIRSGEYTRINVVDIKEGELKSLDILNEEITAVMIDDPDVREKAKTMGYYAMFELRNGFRKAIYWSKSKMEAHAKEYSKAFSGKTNDSFWHKDFDGMAFKTMLRQLISKWGIMSIEMQNAFQSDMGVLDEKGNVQYVDNDNDIKLEKTLTQVDSLDIQENIQIDTTAENKSKNKPKKGLKDV